jgi:hypothetical protein
MPLRGECLKLCLGSGSFPDRFLIGSGFSCVCIRIGNPDLYTTSKKGKNFLQKEAGAEASPV